MLYYRRGSFWKVTIIEGDGRYTNGWITDSMSDAAPSLLAISKGRHERARNEEEEENGKISKVLKMTPSICLAKWKEGFPCASLEIRPRLDRRREFFFFF